MTNDTIPRVQWDLLAYSRDGRPVLAVEAKKRLNASRRWAAQLRRNILAHDAYPDARYFLLALPDTFYLWTDSQQASAEQEPLYVIDAKSILQPYFERIGTTAEEISGPSFELVVGLWLSDLLNSDQPPEDIEKTQSWLVKSGLYQAIRGGHIEQEA
ncbi:MAG: hypothetical protein M1546_22785 [Chloroflexi bacterium]|nr:hypothetical protein [Chloroflexota bacterium]